MTASRLQPEQAARIISGFLALLKSDAGLEFSATLHTEPPPAHDTHPAQPQPVISVDLSGPDLELLLARNGELLHAIEHISAKLLGLETEQHDLIRFDADGFKARRDRELFRTAEEAIALVRSTNRPYQFSPMSSRERRLLHLALTSSGLPTSSTGEPPRRFVVLYPEGAVPAANGNGSSHREQPSSSDRVSSVRERFRRR